MRNALTKTSPLLDSRQLTQQLQQGSNELQLIKNVPGAPTRSSRDLDQFYTDYDVAADFWDVACHVTSGTDRWVEPSGGRGSFYRLCPRGSLGIDLDPQFPGIVEEDFLKSALPAGELFRFIGNPPFGKKGAGAIAFFNHAAERASYICMILPPTFRKASVVNRLNPLFHVIHDEVVPQFAFIFEGKPYHVPAVFQIWERQTTSRLLMPTPVDHADFVFTGPCHADVAIRRVGAKAGQLSADLAVSNQSHYFIRCVASHARLILKTSIFRDAAAEFARNATGQPSLAKPELIMAYDIAARSVFATRRSFVARSKPHWPRNSP